MMFLAVTVPDEDGEEVEDSFLMTKTWDTVRKKIERSRRTWEKPARH